MDNGDAGDANVFILFLQLIIMAEAGVDINWIKVNEGDTVHFVYSGWLVEIDVIGYVSKIKGQCIEVGNERWKGFPKGYIDRNKNYKIDKISGLERIERSENLP